MISTPYLIQRVRHKSNNGTLDDRFRWEYMGAAEFEFGTLPRSIWSMRYFDETEDLEFCELAIGESVLFYVGPSVRKQEAIQLVEEEVTHASVRRKEWTNIDRALSSDEECSTDGWLAVAYPISREQVLEPARVPFFLSLTREAAESFFEGLRAKKVSG